MTKEEFGQCCDEELREESPRYEEEKLFYREESNGQKSTCHKRPHSSQELGAASKRLVLAGQRWETLITG